jgi:hypothetical protein
MEYNAIAGFLFVRAGGASTSFALCVRLEASKARRWLIRGG